MSQSQVMNFYWTSSVLELMEENIKHLQESPKTIGK